MWDRQYAFCVHAGVLSCSNRSIRSFRLLNISASMASSLLFYSTIVMLFLFGHVSKRAIQLVSLFSVNIIHVYVQIENQSNLIISIIGFVR